MAKDIILFNKDELTYKNKFYRLMDLLISKQAESLGESYLLLTIFYLQILSSFFSDQIGVFKSSNGKSDQVLSYIEKIIRLKGLFRNYYSSLRILTIVLFIIELVIILHFLLSILLMTKKYFYSYNNMFINYYIKIFLYIAYNIICDISFSNFCLGSEDFNPNFNNVMCSNQKKPLYIIISLVFVIISLIIYNYINIYYNDSFYISNSYFAIGDLIVLLYHYY